MVDLLGWGGVGEATASTGYEVAQELIWITMVIQIGCSKPLDTMCIIA